MVRKRGQIIIKQPGVYLVRVSLGEEAGTGKRKFLSKTIRGTKKDAQLELAKLLHQQSEGRLNPPSQLTVNQFLDEWLRSKGGSIEERTLLDYELTLKRYVRPFLGERRLDKLTPRDIQELINTLKEKKRSSRTIRGTHVVLSSALAQAVKQQLLPRNPAEGALLPARQQSEMMALGPEEARRFLEEAAKDRWGLLFALALYTGMRPGEIRALQWKDFDLENRIVTIRRAVSKGRDGWYFKPTKTKQVRRNPLPPSLVARLEAYRAEQKVLQGMIARADFVDHDLVFANESGRPLDEGNLIQRHFKPILKRAGLPAKLRLYDLRHSMATLLLHTDENIKVISERLGHSDATMTLNVYAHALPTMQEAATRKLDALLTSEAKEEEGGVDAAET
ncbi:Transposase [compost metagenome]